MSVCTRSLTASLCCGLVLLAGCSGGGGSTGYESPEACFDGIRDALVKQDYQKALASVTDETQNVAAAGLVMMGTMMQAFAGMAGAMGGEEGAAKEKEALDAVAAVMEKHGLDEKKLKALGEDENAMGPMGDEAAMAKVADLVKDKSGFILDMVNALSKMGDGPGPNPQELVDALATAKLEDLKIDGDQATATLTAESKPPAPIAFRKTADGWKLHIDMKEMSGGPDAEMSGDFGDEQLGDEVDVVEEDVEMVADPAE